MTGNTPTRLTKPLIPHRGPSDASSLSSCSPKRAQIREGRDQSFSYCLEVCHSCKCKEGCPAGCVSTSRALPVGPRGSSYLRTCLVSRTSTLWGGSGCLNSRVPSGKPSLCCQEARRSPSGCRSYARPPEGSAKVGRNMCPPQRPLNLVPKTGITHRLWSCPKRLCQSRLRGPLALGHLKAFSSSSQKGCCGDHSDFSMATHRLVEVPALHDRSPATHPVTCLASPRTPPPHFLKLPAHQLGGDGDPSRAVRPHRFPEETPSLPLPEIVGNTIKPSNPLYISPVNYKTQVRVPIAPGQCENSRFFVREKQKGKESG